MDQELGTFDRRDARRGRLRTAAAAAVAGVALLATLGAAPADARPSKDKAGRGNVALEPTTTTTSAPSAAAETVSADGTLRRAALRLTVATTSDWVQVDLPGVSAGHVVVENPQGRQVQPTSRGVVVRGPVRTYGSVTVDVVTEVARTLQQGAITVTQGGAGSTTTSLDEITGERRPVASISTDWATTTRAVAVTADHLMGDEQLEWVRADDQRRVLAFTYPWFGDGATTDERLSVHPVDPWNSDQGTEALRITQEARANGIDGFVMSFSGGARHGLPLHHTLRAAEQTGGTASVLIETAEAGSVAAVEQWIAEALKQSDSPSFLRLDGVPVVFAFASGSVTAADWQAISDRLAAAGTPVRIIADTWHGQDGAVAGQYRYNALLQSPTDEMTEAELTGWNQAVSRGLRARATLGVGRPGLVVATVQPGWDDRPLRGADRLVVPWDGTSTYDRTWRAALAGEADWVVVTSWNEWFEGTGVAPSVEHGDAALMATAAWAERFTG